MQEGRDVVDVASLEMGRKGVWGAISGPSGRLGPAGWDRPEDPWVGVDRAGHRHRLVPMDRHRRHLVPKGRRRYFRRLDYSMA